MGITVSLLLIACYNNSVIGKCVMCGCGGIRCPPRCPHEEQ